MQFQVMQHSDHDWREPCEGQCADWLTIEADSAEDAVKSFYVAHPNVDCDNELVDIVKTTAVKTVAEGVYILAFGDSDDDWFAFVVKG